MSRQFRYTTDEQRTMWLSLVNSLQEALDGVRRELATTAPDADLLDLHCGTIQHDLSALRHAYMMQFGVRPYYPPVKVEGNERPIDRLHRTERRRN